MVLRADTLTPGQVDDPLITCFRILVRRGRMIREARQMTGNRDGDHELERHLTPERSEHAPADNQDGTK